ncbi:MAG: tRNA (adenosine(37)-N6)-threonylcarbamoyltransferase complex transferase subunit TsaD, partial [Flavobacteriales bacterium]|nr:tRNA (adenosine(37)-N6)-threonylcarbamoyltransferase complex transferase subunit TsaD [Flavobacteriales bacterium]
MVISVIAPSIRTCTCITWKQPVSEGPLILKRAISPLFAELEPVILAIESSCDETSAAVLRGRRVLSNIIATQKVHEKYGGVVPELASRAHQSNIVPVVQQALMQAEVDKADLNAIAVTMGPGLMGSLHVGTSFAKSLTLALNIPLIAVHHMQAHVLALFIEDAQERPVPEFPFLCLTVSGGHTQLVHVESESAMHIVGQTIDDAAGEAFDKAAKVLGFDYPGGPLIDKWARDANTGRFAFPHPRVADFDFSFSGLKTSLLYLLRDNSDIQSELQSFD